MKKEQILLLVVLILSFLVTPLFAENSGAIIGTFGFGSTSFDSEYIKDAAVALSVDFDIVSKFGFNISFGNMVNFVVGQYLVNVPYIGIGYRYLADNWDAGLSIVCIPFFNDALVGVRATGGYWINNNFGFNLTMMLGGGAVTEMSAFSIRAGVSVKK